MRLRPSSLVSTAANHDVQEEKHKFVGGVFRPLERNELPPPTPRSPAGTSPGTAAR